MISCPQAANGCTRSSTTGFGSLRAGWPRGQALQPSGNDLPYRFSPIVDTLARLLSRSCIIDGEAVARDDDGVTSFNLVRYRRHDENILLYAFDLIELNGDDLRPEPLEGRKATLEIILANAGLGIRFNEHMENDGSITIADHKTSVSLENEYWDCLRAIAAERGVRLGALVAAARNVP